ncbi:MAG TPA: hypothetical protein VLR52_01295, partial [Bacteroidales bacterium]|nr:hypothetical protein [Bacteroidales bacterium]
NDQTRTESSLLKQNAPNPFSSSTNIEYTVPEKGKVSLRICDLLGREIITLVDDIRQEGVYKIDFTPDEQFCEGI